MDIQQLCPDLSLESVAKQDAFNAFLIALQEEYSYFELERSQFNSKKEQLYVENLQVEINQFENIGEFLFVQEDPVKALKLYTQMDVLCQNDFPEETYRYMIFLGKTQNIK